MRRTSCLAARQLTPSRPPRRAGRVIANIMLPMPVVLTLLLVIPFPRNVRKGILLFTNTVLSFPVCECGRWA